MANRRGCAIDIPDRVNALDSFIIIDFSRARNGIRAIR